MNEQTMRAGWARLWRLRIYRTLLESSQPADVELAEIRRGLARLRLRGIDDATDAATLRERVAAMLARRSVDERVQRHALFADAARVFGLDVDSLRILAFVCTLHANEDLRGIVVQSRRYPSTRPGVQRMLGDALGIPLARLRRALRMRGPLVAGGLLHVHNGNYGDASELIEPAASFAALVEDGAGDVRRFLERLFERAEGARLQLGDYAHLAGMIERLREYLAAAARERRGCNVLLHGPPGTGKSELARVLAQALDLELFLVRSADEDGEPVEGLARLHAFETAQRALVANPRAMLLFDEIEDVFRLPSAARQGGGAIAYKSWINRHLESARLPCLWIGNRIDCMDDSQLRRFDIALEITPPPRRVRRAMLEGMFAPLGASATLLDVIAEREGFAPAHFARAARVIERTGAGTPERIERALRDSLDEILVLRGMPPLAQRLSDAPFDIAYAQLDQPLAPILDLLERQPDARLCLYGPPGTGKSALAGHIAERVDRPLLKRRASDLLSPYLGETEHNIADMFREARREGAVLCLDEADSFLRDRSQARHAWEVSQVNELLTRLEDHQGLFVASTNLMDLLDPAAMRRFDFKLRFGWLDLGQRRRLFDDCTRRHGLKLDVEADELEVRLRALDRIVPGDFVAQRRRLECAAHPGQRLLLDALAAEQALKPGASRAPIGFVRS